MNKEKNIKKNFSFDDLEIEKLKSNFDKTYQQESEKKILEKPLEKKSKIAQFFGNVWGKFLGKTFKIIEFFKNKWDKFTQSKVGKILLSNSLNYAISLTGAVIAVSGLFTPVSPIVITVAAITAVGVGIQAINETVKIRNLCKLHKENNLLVQNRNAKAQQDYILSLEPRLKDSLKSELFTPPKKEKDFNSDKYKISSKNLKSIGIVFSNNIAAISTAIIQGASGNVLGILKATGYGIMTSVSLITGGLSEKEKKGIKTIFKLNINEECKKHDTPDYKNLDQLEKYTKEQILQTAVLKKLITDKNYWKMKDNDKREKFHEIRNTFIGEIRNNGFNDFCNKNKVSLNIEKESYAKDIGRVMNPFYEKPNKAQEYSNLANVMNKRRRSAISR
ncbi:hypothetical protein [Rickettsia endosymbiont of Rhinocyllus conicus]|uniref:hypothetical protein n=1 Tax=Rickettsia endosymbiont of Rhinocyllus conicus TaxID=3066252 RepID=UPI003132FFB8